MRDAARLVRAGRHILLTQCLHEHLDRSWFCGKAVQGRDSRPADRRTSIPRGLQEDRYDLFALVRELIQQRDGPGPRERALTLRRGEHEVEILWAEYIGQC